MTVGEPFRLGDWLVYPSLNRLSRGGETASIQPRFMDLLVFLAEKPGKVVSKEEILAAVWAREFVSEGTLTHAVAVIRQTLGDSVKNPQYLETIPTRGYRLVAPVAAAEGAEPPAGAASRARVPARRSALTVAAVLFAVVAGAAAVWWLSAGSRAKPPHAATRRIVVLPFQNLGLAAQDYIASGITDDITTRLAAAHAVGVVSRTSAINCARTGQSVRQISEELGVDYVLEGTVREGAGRPDAPVLVNAQLIRASDDTSLWAGSFAASASDVVDVGAAIAGRVIDELGITVERPEQSRLRARPTDDPNAYQAYLCGIRYRDLASREQLGLAVAMYERAVALDPSFALAWAELAVANARTFQLRIDDSPHRVARAKLAADRALTLRPALPEAHLAVGAVEHLCRHNYGVALEQYSIAARHLPNDSGLFALIADVYRRQGRWAEARAETERVVNLDPQNYTALLALGDTLQPLRAYREADTAFQRAADLNPDRNAPYLRRFWNLLAWDGSTDRAERALDQAPLPNEPEVIFARSFLRYLRRDFRGALDALAPAPPDATVGSYRFAAKPLTQCLYLNALGDRAGVSEACGAALAVLEEVSRRRPEDPDVLLEVGEAQVMLGYRDEALRAGEKAIALVRAGSDAYEGPNHLLRQARILAHAGEGGRAVALLGQLLANPGPISVAWLRMDPGWDRIRGDAGFKALTQAATPLPR